MSKRKISECGDVRVTRALSKRMTENSSLPCFVRGCEYFGLRSNGFKCSEHCGLFVPPPKPVLLTEQMMYAYVELMGLPNLKVSTVNWYFSVKKMISKQTSFMNAAKAVVKMLDDTKNEKGELEVSIFSTDEVLKLMEFANTLFDGKGESYENKRHLSHVLTRLCIAPWNLHFKGTPILSDSICYYGYFGEAPQQSPEAVYNVLTRWKNIKYENGVKWTD